MGASATAVLLDSLSKLWRVQIDVTARLLVKSLLCLSHHNLQLLATQLLLLFIHGSRRRFLVVLSIHLQKLLLLVLQRTQLSLFDCIAHWVVLKLRWGVLVI